MSETIVSQVDSLPDCGWQKRAIFPDWKGYTDDTLLDILLKKEEDRLDSLYPAFEEATLALLRALRGYVVGRMEEAHGA